MPSFIIKHGGIWAGGKLHDKGAIVELSEKDREKIDPTGELLASESDAKAEAAHHASESTKAAEKAKQLASKGGSK